MEALHDTVRAGKVRYLGASTMYAWQFAKMNHVAAVNGWTPFINMQCQYNVLYREEEREMFPYCRDQGVAVTTFSPLARGFLARDAGTARTTHDKYQEFYGDEIDREIARRVSEVAARRGVSRAHVAMAWVAGSPNHNIPIVGAAKTAHLEVAVKALNSSGLDGAKRILFPFTAAHRVDAAQKVAQLLRRQGQRLDIQLLALAAEHDYSNSRNRD